VVNNGPAPGCNRDPGGVVSDIDSHSNSISGIRHLQPAFA